MTLFLGECIVLLEVELRTQAVINHLKKRLNLTPFSLPSLRECSKLAGKF